MIEAVNKGPEQPMRLCLYCSHMQKAGFLMTQLLVGIGKKVKGEVDEER